MDKLIDKTQELKQEVSRLLENPRIDHNSIETLKMIRVKLEEVYTKALDPLAPDHDRDELWLRICTVEGAVAGIRTIY